MIEGASILVTGGTGAFGVAFAKHLLKTGAPPKRLVIFSRGEYRQFLVRQELAPLDQEESLRYMIGDVRDRSRLRRALEGIEIIVHAAALKRIEVGQYNPIEMVRTNIEGAINVIEAAQDAKVKKVVFLSSDKAYQPISPYGQTKALAESLFLEANNTTGWTGPKFAICRYGNIWRSTGSVVPIWENLIQKNYPIHITDPDCTRFFMRMAEAVQLVSNTISTMEGGEIRIPTLPAYRLGDLAEAMGAKDIKILGLPIWEKKAESMAEGNCSETARRMTISEIKQELEYDKMCCC